MPTAHFEISLPRTGRYEVRLAYSSNGNRATTRVPATVHYVGGERTVLVNEKQKPLIDDLFVSLGVFEFSADKPAAVVVSNQCADGYVVIDAVQRLPK